MTSLAVALGGALGGVLVLVMGYRWVFTLAWLSRGRRESSDLPAPPLQTPRFALLIPAHDEELLIEAAVASVRACEYPRGAVEVYVIADRCSDRTAERALRAGAKVWERKAPAPPGKGPALSWALERVDLEHFDAVAVVDADNLVDPGFFREMSAWLVQGERVLQGYDGLSNPEETMLTRLIAVTSVMKNLFFYGGKSVLGLSPLLMGTGMVFSASLLRERAWGAESIGEDLEQGLDLLRAGECIRFVPEARVYAQEASSFRQGTAQRQRWSSGRQQLRGRAWRSLREGLASRRPDLAHAAAELIFPTYAMTLNLTLLAGAVAGAALPKTAIPLGLVGAALAAQVLEVAMALREMRAGPRFFAALLVTPAFLLWRGAIDVLAVFGFRRHRWSRTQRRTHEAPRLEGDGR